MDEVLKSFSDSRKNRHAVRWYVMTLPPLYKGAAKYLQAELERRRGIGEPLFEYFAPVYVEPTKDKNGRMGEARLPLLYNYVFIHASEEEIRRLKLRMPEYSFLPRVEHASVPHYPYLPDAAMENFRWVSQIYSGMLPAYVPDLARLIKGDRVRISGGEFDGVEATVVRTVGTATKEVVVCVDDWVWVPLIHVKPEQCEVVSSDNSKALYALLDDERHTLRLQDALLRLRQGRSTTDADRAAAVEVLRLFRSLQVSTDILRSKLYSLMLMAYTVLDNPAGREEMGGNVSRLLSTVRAGQVRALLAVTLYACTGNPRYARLAQELVAPWRSEEKPKKSKRLLIERLDRFTMER